MKYINEEHFTKKHSTITENIQDVLKLEKVDTPKATLEGYLFIQSKSLWRFPQHLWKKRYFTLINDTLYFTKHEEEIINEENTATRIEIEADSGIYPEENVKGKSKFYIRITQGKQNFILCSPDEIERNKWLSSLLTVITQKYVVNFKGGAYKSIRLNYKEKKQIPIKQRHSSFVPRRFSDDDRQNEFKIKTHFGSLVLTKAESMFNLNQARDTLKDRKSLVAFI